MAHRLSGTIAELILAAPATPSALWHDLVAVLAAHITRALAYDPTAPAAIAAGLRQALAAAITEPEHADERLTAALALFSAAMARVAQDADYDGSTRADTHGFGRLVG
jgi:hypothetical protein